MSSFIRTSDKRWHGGAKRPLEGQSLKGSKRYSPQPDDDDDLCKLIDLHSFHFPAVKCSRAKR